MTEARYTVRTLAAHWRCSESHIYKMVADGRLQGFRLGGKLLRFSAGDVERAEGEWITAWGGSRASSSSCGRKVAGATDSALARSVRLRREQPLESLQHGETPTFDHRNSGA